MEQNEVSLHLARIVSVIRKHGNWITSKDVSVKAEVSDRTARMHLLRLVKSGIVEETRVFPGYRYRFSDQAAKKNGPYLQKLESASVIFGL